ncbi:MAG: hypothetical protein HY673_22760 [Chloroflexi bacterium]|nr:hypothetical protein [Chloroflexota bacterium]
MASWQITLTTVYCESTRSEVTIIVNRDLTARCTGCEEAPPGEPGPRHTNRENLAGCEGPECRLVVEYREKLLGEERRQGSSWE